MSHRYILPIVVSGIILTTYLSLLSGCGDKKNPVWPEQPIMDCPYNPFDYFSARLLANPVVSPGDGYIYYEDNGLDSAYYDAWVENLAVAPWLSDGFEPGIYRINPNDNSAAELVIGRAAAPEITPDGSELYFGHNDGNVNGIWRIRLPDGKPELIKEGSFANIQWFAKDTLIVHRAYDLNAGIFLFDINADSLYPLPGIGPGFDVSKERKICYVGYDSDSLIWSIGVYDFDADSTWNIYVNNMNMGQPLRWSPDGKSIVFVGSRGENIDIYTVTINGELKIFPGRIATEPSYTPDGKDIVFIRWPYSNCIQYQATQIWIMAAGNGSRMRRITTWSRIRP